MEKKRIEYIDALRGFTMLLVVMCHVSAWGHISGNGAINDFLSDLMLPLFFFISGFVIYRDVFETKIIGVLKFIVSKFNTLIVPTAIISIVYCWFCQSSLFDLVIDKYKGGYWFTFTLFLFLLAYSLIRFICDKSTKKPIVALSVLSLIGLLLYRQILSAGIYEPTSFFYVLSLDKFSYFIYFALGLIVRKYFVHFQQILDNKYLSAVLIALFVIVSGILPLSLENVSFNRYRVLISGILGVIVVFAVFRFYEDFFSQRTVCGRVLQRIGKRTLDVYFLHYFIIPKNIGVLGDLFYSDSSAVLSLILRFSVALLIAYFCLLIGNVLRISPFIAKWLFGASDSTAKSA